jgi:hypothetical protein
VRVETDGRLECIEGPTAVGWAAEPGGATERVSLDMYIDHRLVAKTVADLPRADLAREGIGDGAHAFRVGIPTWLRDGGVHSISVVVPPVGVTLRAARGWEARNRTAPDETRFTWAWHDTELPLLPGSRVLGSHDGWSFPCDDAFGSIEQMLGGLTLTLPELDRYRVLIDHRAGKLAAAGIPYVVAIVPAKAAVHPDRLPEGSPPLGPPELARQLLAALAGGRASVIDLLPPLADAARAGRQLYYKRDAGWNYEGAVIAAAALLEEVRNAGVVAGELDPEAIPWLQESFVGGLAGRPAVTLQDGRFHSVASTNAAEAASRPDEQAIGVRRAAAPEGLAERLPNWSVIEHPATIKGSCAIVLHDEGGRRLMPFLGACFSRSVWVPQGALDAELIQAARPTVVIQVLDEPQLVRVPYID